MEKHLQNPVFRGYWPRKSTKNDYLEFEKSAINLIPSDMIFVYDCFSVLANILQVVSPFLVLQKTYCMYLSIVTCVILYLDKNKPCRDLRT